MPTLCVASALAAAGLAVSPPEAIYTNIESHPTREVPGAGGYYFFDWFGRPAGSADGSDWVLRSGVRYLWEPTHAFLAGAGTSGSMVAVEPTSLSAGTQVEPGRDAERVRDGRGAINNAGTFAIPLEITGDITDDDVVVTGTVGGSLSVALRQGDAVSSIAGASLGTSVSDVGIDAAGDLAVRSTTLAGPAAGSDAAILLDDGAALAGQVGVTVPTGQSGTAAPWRQITPGTFWSAADGTSWLAKGVLDTAAASDQVLVVNGAVEVREGETFGGMSSPVRHIVGQTMTPAGDWFARGENTDGGAWAARNGAVLFESGDTVPGTTEHWANSPPGLNYDLNLYTSTNMVQQEQWTQWPTSVYDVSIGTVEVQNGLDVTVKVTNTSATLSAPWPKFELDLGWDNAGTTPTPQRVWWARHKFQAFDLNNEQQDKFYGLGGYQQLASNCLAVDDGASGSQTVGFSTDYPYLSYVILDKWQGYEKVVFQPSGTTPSQQRVIPDWIRPQESKTIRFWLRRVSAVGEDAALAVVQPYVDHLRDTYPSNRPPKLKGRLMGIALASASQPDTNREYVEFDDPFDSPDVGPITPSSPDCSGWHQYLEAVVNDTYGDVPTQTPGSEVLAQADYVGVMLWAMTGVKGINGVFDDDNFFPSIIRNLDTSLATTLPEVAEWEEEQGLGVYAWAGHAFRGYQDGVYDSTVDKFPLSSGHYSAVAPVTDPNNDPLPGDPLYPPQLFPPLGTPASDAWATWTLEADAIVEFDANVHDAFQWFSGVGLDAMPDPAQDPWVLDELEAIRAQHPDKWYCAEPQMSDRSVGLAPSYYLYNAPEDPGVPPFQGIGPFAFEGRCPLLERIYPGYQSMVQVRRPNDQNALDADVGYVETEGMIALTFDGLPSIPYAGPEEEPAQQDLDRYGSTFFAHFGNGLGDSVVAGFTDAADAGERAVWVLNTCRVVLREGDPVDLDGDGLLDDDAYVDVTGATAAGLTSLADNGFLADDMTLYLVVNLRSASMTAMGEAFIRVPICRADFDGDGALTIADYTLFDVAYQNGSPCADFDRSGSLSLNDYSAFQNAYALGCP